MNYLIIWVWNNILDILILNTSATLILIKEVEKNAENGNEKKFLQM